MKTDWQVNVFVLINASIQLDEDEGVEHEIDSLGKVTAELVNHPENCSLDYFDSRDSWSTEDAVGLAYMTKLTYEYADISEKQVKIKVLKDFQKTQFDFDSPSDEIDCDIDFVAAWAFFDKQNPNEDEELEVEEEFMSDEVLPNFIYGFGLEVESDEDFVGSAENWHLSEENFPEF
jgi:hypothetical protein